MSDEREQCEAYLARRVGEEQTRAEQAERERDHHREQERILWDRCDTNAELCEMAERDLQEALDLLVKAAPKLSYAPPQLTRKGQAPATKESWLRDDIETLLRRHGRLPSG